MSQVENSNNADQTPVSNSKPIQQDDTTVASLDSGVITDKSNNHSDDCINLQSDEHHPSTDDDDGLLTKESVYEAVLGANDQELAKRQYVDDEADDDETFDCLPKRKRLATNTNHPNATHLGSYGKHNDGITKGSPELSNSNIDYDADTSSQQNGSSIVASSDCENSDSGRQSNEPEQLRKLFIGGLDWKTSEETLKRHFGKFGDVIDCVVMRDPQTKRSRGFGFVIYAKSIMVDRAQEARPHEVDGREVQPKRAISREDSGKPEAEATVKKVYLGGLSDDIEEAELRDYFKDFGNIVSINIVVHKDTGKRRGFAFIEYDDWDPVDKIVLKKFHKIRDKRVEAKKAIPKNEMDARKRVDPRSAMSGSMMSIGGIGPTLDGSGRSGRGSARGNAFGQAYLWDAPYGGLHPGYPGSGLDGYPPHYHSASSHYSDNWMMHGGNPGSSPYGFRGSHGGGGAYGRSGYSGQAALAAASAAAAAAANGWPDYAGFPVVPSQGTGPMRHLASYQHRSYRPYANGSGPGGGYGGSTSRGGRGYNP